jgi:Kelch motif
MRFIYSIFFIFSISSVLTCSGTLLDNPPGEEGGDSIKMRGIWMVGGLSGGGTTGLLAHGTVVGAVDIYDPVTNTWFPAVTSIPVPVSFAGVASIKISDNDHRIYVFGGFDSAGVARNLVQYYTIETDTWSTGTVIPAVRANIYAARIYNKIYIMGGNAADASATFAAQTTTYEYNPSGDSWDISKTAFSATATADRFMMVYDDVIYNMGGRTAFATIAATGSSHDGFVYSWGTNGTLTTGITEIPLGTAPSVIRTGIAGDMYKPSNGPALMILAGGFSAMGKTATATSVLHLTNASTPSSLVQYLAYPFSGTGQVWVSASAVTFPAIGFGSAVVYHSESVTPNFRFYYFGGTASLIPASATGSTNARWSDLPPQPPATWNNTWTSIANMPTGRYGFTALTIQQ